MVQALLGQSFRPEFLNRIDETVIFVRLSQNELARIVDLQLNELRDRLAQHHIALDVSEKARQWLGQRGYDPTLGARPLRRLIQRSLQDKVAMLLLNGAIAAGDTVGVEVQGDDLAVEKQL